MQSDAFGYDLIIMLLSYGYVLVMILVAGLLYRHKLVNAKTSRKILHSMIGNLIFVIPYFTWRFAPFIVSSPFIIITFLASPFSPHNELRKKMKGLAGISEQGHHTGLILYSISYSLLALLFPEKPIIIASGILPMSYGDSIAAIIGEKYGQHRLIDKKSLIGSVTMFSVSLISLIFSFYYFAGAYSYGLPSRIYVAIITSAIVTITELFTPKGYDNLTVPLIGAASFILSGGI